MATPSCSCMTPAQLASAVLRRAPLLLPAAPMRVVCAWCGRVLREGAEPTSHGMCAACAEAVEPLVQEIR